jgi:predicted NAD-dependent protein-ADP-ribosyltransferase YbiA (DUF1768 family)
MLTINQKLYLLDFYFKNEKVNNDTSTRISTHTSTYTSIRKNTHTTTMTECKESSTNIQYIRYFYSKSSNKNDKYLSNFQILKKDLTFRGCTFPSIEHAFNAAKFWYIKGKPYNIDKIPDAVQHLRSDNNGNGKLISALDAKRYGSRTSFKKLKLELDENAWNKARFGIMKELVYARTLVDEVYRNDLINTAKNNGRFFHFERSSAKSVWGGSFVKNTTEQNRCIENWRGSNYLGIIMDQVGKELALNN